ncbi:MAG: hypothetical protein A2521_15600 [Deltaproteobacteria bacterium RIFOXYD12_FULL_57_12]|nr:MAG: hypothetical protein A2521_15600 [Deltaproteobacteria bacterium RIFOXYD12_FULL_57_12]
MNIAEHNGGYVSRSLLTSQWKGPLNLALVLHLLALVAAFFGPALCERRPLMPEVYSVNLYTAAEFKEAGPAGPAPAAPVAAKPKPEEAPSAPPAPPEPAAPAKPKVAIEPETPPKIVPIPEVAPQTPTKAISIEPLKQKIAKKEEPTPKEVQVKDQRNIDKALENIQAKVEADAKEKVAREKAAQLRDAAVKEIAANLRRPASSTGTAPPSTTTPAKTGTAAQAGGGGGSGPTGGGSSAVTDSILRGYYAAVLNHIQAHWILPDTQNWDNKLKATLAITVHRDGSITDTAFEKSSDNVYFNQFILKTMREATPLPPFPAGLDETSLEIGLNFDPGGTDIQ